MKHKKWLALILAGMMTVGTLASCSNSNTDEPGETTIEASGTVTEGNGTDEPTPPTGTDEEPELITVVDAKGTEGLSGDLKAVWAEETGGENVVTGTGQKPINHSVSAVLASPTVLTSVVLTAPSGNQELLADSTIEASVNGSDWVVLKSLGSTITAGKTYTMNIGDKTPYLYVRIRQSDGLRTQAYAVRTVVFYGVPQTGEAGSLANIADETDPSKPIIPNSYIASSVKTGEPADAFTDNENSFTAAAGSAGTPNYLIVTLKKKTEIRKVVVKMFNEQSRRIRGTVMQGSNDGVNWTALYTFPDLDKDEQNNYIYPAEFTYYVNDATAYSFLRLVQRNDLAEYEWTLDTILLSGIESDEDANELPDKYINSKTVYVSFHQSNTEPHSAEKDIVTSVFDLSDTTTMYTHEQHPDLTARVEYWIAGKMVGPTVITKIVYYAPATNLAYRVRTSYFEASVDGETWVKIATLPGGSAPYPDTGAVITLNVDDDTAYNYIRLVQGESFFKYYWTVGTIEVVGVCDTPNPEQPEKPTQPEQPEVPEQNAVRVDATYRETNITPSGTSNAATVFGTDKTQFFNRAPLADTADPTKYYISASFAVPTVITKIEYVCAHNSANRARTCYFEASVDGETWVKLAALPESLTRDTVYTLDVKDSTAYSYIRLVVADGFQSYWITFGVVDVWGIQKSDSGAN